MGMGLLSVSMFRYVRNYSLQEFVLLYLILSFRKRDCHRDPFILLQQLRVLQQGLVATGFVENLAK